MNGEQNALRNFKMSPFCLNTEAKSLREIFTNSPHLLNLYFCPFLKKGSTESCQIFVWFSTSPCLQNHQTEKSIGLKSGNMGTILEK